MADGQSPQMRTAELALVLTGSPRQTARALAVPETHLDACEKRIAERRSVGHHLGFSIFANPAWDMLLDLYRAAALGEDISISSLALASNVPATTARRYIASMVAAKLVAFRPDPADRRRVYVVITRAGFEALTHVFDDVR